jgi:uncharacterized protein (TIGR03435 family)
MPAPPDAPAPEASDTSGVNIFASIQTLGLNLDERKAPFEHLVLSTWKNHRPQTDGATMAVCLSARPNP